MAIKKRIRETGKIIPAQKANARARVVSRQVDDVTGGLMTLLTKSQQSQQLDDIFQREDYALGIYRNPIEPIFPFKDLITVYTESNILRQCIDSYVVNIESYGHVFEYVGPEGSRNKKEVKDELNKVTALMARLSYEDDLIDLRSKSRVDYEVLAARAFEIGRDDKGRIEMMAHIPMHSLRMCKKDQTPVMVDVEVVDEKGGISTVKVERTFRRFVQKSYHTNKMIYFKEFGDPRVIDPNTGEENPGLSPEDAASEVLFDSQYVPGHVYGLPRWIGQLPSILGSKESELVNLHFFRDNAIPAMAVLVSGGYLTQEAFDKISNYVTNTKGQKSMQRIMVIESLADDATGGSIDHPPQAPKLDIKPMVNERQQDGLFQDYDENNAGKVRSAFRLPPIFVGRAEDYTRASAFASMQTAENQIFVPERFRFDMIINNKILATHGIKYWRFKSLGAPLSDPDSMARIVRSLGTQGALTANTVIKVANQILNVQIDSIQEAWGDVPFSIIEGYIRQGLIIEGLDSFVKQIKTEVPDAEPIDTEEPSDPTVTESFKKGLLRLADDLTDANKEALQTSAKKVKRKQIKRG